MIGFGGSLLKSGSWGHSYQSRRQRTDLGSVGQTGPNEGDSLEEGHGFVQPGALKMF